MSRNYKSVERRKSLLCCYLYLVAAEIRAKSNDMEDVVFKGYTRIPTKVLTLTVRRSPNGEGKCKP